MTRKIRIKRKDGKIQRYKVKSTKPYRYNRKKRYWIKKIKRVRKYYRSLIQIMFYHNTDAVDTGFGIDKPKLKLRLWINSNKIYTRQQLLLQLRKLPQFGQKLGSQIGKGKLFYKVDYEKRLITKAEADNLKQFQHSYGGNHETTDD